MKIQKKILAAFALSGITFSAAFATYIPPVHKWDGDGSSTFTTSGSVGIGNTSPTEDLDVTGDVKASGTLEVISNAILNTLGISATALTTAENRIFNIQTWETTDGSAQNRITVLANGSVGIGTSSPTKTLEVSGTAKITGNTSITSTETSVSKDTGALVVEGGVGIEENLHAGQDVTVGQDLSVTGRTYATGGFVLEMRNDDPTSPVDGQMWFNTSAVIPDTTPDAFTFTDQTDVAVSTLTTSNSITISGINIGASVSVTGDGSPQVSIAGGAWGTSGTINNGESLQVRLTSSANGSTASTATVTVGGVSDSWSVTTESVALTGGSNTERVVFVTTGAWAGNFGGLSQADAYCQTEAEAASLNGKYKAWLSTDSISAASRLTHSSLPYALVDGTVVDNSWTDLTNGLYGSNLNPIDIAADGTTIASGKVWTGTNGFGDNVGTSCSDWTSNSSSVNGRAGTLTSHENGEWTDGTNYACNDTAHLYCFEQDTVTDARDGKTYETVQIGSQTWMAENLNVGTMLASSGTDPSNDSTIEKWCYDDSESICDTEGGLYSWEEAMAYSTTEGTQGICMTGWHIPTDGEWHTLESSLATGSCSSTRSTSWDCDPAGTALKPGGSTGFNALMAGLRDESTPMYEYRGTHSLFWTSSTGGATADNAWWRAIFPSNSTVYRAEYIYDRGFSIRCIKD